MIYDTIKDTQYSIINNTKKGNLMQPILAHYTASIAELKKSPTQLLKDAGDEAVAILNHNVASAYLVPSSLYEKMMDIIDEHYLSKMVDERLNYNEDELIEVSLDDL